ncbi:MAG: bifunctional phosphoribosylaminoimidazolecarboxamide formyltransferase/IMP cyclohydrolase [Candidatus Micrarchaeia archaeon]|jgi:phosphoribosylaminoimidazolecarboxamide formyltransferase/IMP cyclohydrolase
MDSVKIRNALISVSDKSGLDTLASSLKKFGVEMISSSGTAAFLKSKGIETIDASKVTGFPEILGGRVKTLHPKLFGAILSKEGSDSDDRDLLENSIGRIDLVVVNLYPFEQTIAKKGATLDEAVENIDVGGPSLLRAAAKNHSRVAVVCDPSDYPEIIAELEKSNGSLSLLTRQKLAAKAFSHTFGYDAAIANYLYSAFNPDVRFPQSLGVSLSKVQDLRYGENPHQKAALYATRSAEGEQLSARRQLWGKELSYNNIADIDAAVSLAMEFSGQHAAVIIKHSNPCGVAVGESNAAAFETALSTDPVSAFGGVICFNNPVTEPEAKKIAQMFCEIVIGPSFDEAALVALKAKKNVRLMEEPLLAQAAANSKAIDYKSVRGGMLVQEADEELYNSEKKVATKRKPTEQEMADLDFAWKVCKHVKSNAVIYVKDSRTIGVGAGQMSRVDSAKIAALKASASKLSTKGCVMASDAFFPFRDGVDEAASAGITAIIQPGGSIRDDEVIRAADEKNIAMVFTGIRHTWH